MSDAGYSGGSSRDNSDGGASNPNRGQGRGSATVAAARMRQPQRGQVIKQIFDLMTGHPPPRSAST
ncbi:Hypothetical predicted protein [Olea europaea subsp. europaea]|uniref:Uncharacterized protein n=1 Tax=Olea europaea subsp. europaea TaxID=158383 RepID=A0A8S0SYB4_OLEEU|nr:Hypothetical predicted protein [Olea europaea subsp. europaea]